MLIKMYNKKMESIFTKAENKDISMTEGINQINKTNKIFSILTCCAGILLIYNGMEYLWAAGKLNERTKIISRTTKDKNCILDGHKQVIKIKGSK